MGYDLINGINRRSSNCKKNGKLCGHCNLNTLFPYEFECTCVLCGYNIMKRKQDLSKIPRKKNYINRLKFAEQKILCICIEIYQFYEVDDYDKLYEVLSTMKNKKFKKKNKILFEKHKDMMKNPDIKQDCY